MTKHFTCLLCLLAMVHLLSCRSQKDSPKFNFADGVYHTSLKGQRQQVYVENTEDSISIYPLKKGWQHAPLKPSELMKHSVSQKAQITDSKSSKYWQNGFDVDILTIPIKFRPSSSTFPKQFSNHLNGAVYLGYRTDVYRLSFVRDPIGRLHEKVKHYGISGGFVTGFGLTPINPWVTNNGISIEYDGMAWSKGVAVLMGVENLTFGLIGAVDHLLDGNRSLWLYQGKPYLGLVVGLNLN
ncbi:hypothetical protein [Dyadobacter sp. CY347]|uniref:hypothetical protein n=1 Tax=Dyadobacter sp. CY347 TaxID=2909336 RepID=UPI001F1F3166|nr:hypothetical protein [Dyadobacter sp. CY347]MCF2489184.1 hypothetical protein [Dyadobacter sp. CY347]